MPDNVRVMVEMRSTPALAATSFGPLAAAPALGAVLPGFHVDASYSPVPILPAPAAGATFVAAAAAATPPTYVVRGSVAADRLDNFIQTAAANPTVVGVFSDPQIFPVAPPVCGDSPPRGT